MFKNFPADAKDVPAMMAWLDRLTANSRGWPGRYFEEFLFVIMVKSYLRGNYLMVHSLSAELPWLKVDFEVRDLFQDENGQVLVQSSYVSITHETFP
jgi:hypothetical protein